MTYSKPELIVLMDAIKAVRTAIPKGSYSWPDAGVMNGFTQNAYEADE
jgi:hypothetical protein